MGKLTWYKRNPHKALKGMMMLTLEERGAYNTVLDLIYSHDGDLLDDEHFIAGWCRVDVRVWRRIRARLIGAEKLYTDGEFLRNETADVEVDRGLSMVASASDAGIKSGQVRAAKRQDELNKNKGVGGTPEQTRAQPPFELFLESQIEEKKEDTPVSSKKDPRGTRLDADFIVPQEWLDWAIVDEKCPPAIARSAAARFPDYWRGMPGQRGIKLDWLATWRNWIRKSMDDDGRSRGGGPAKPTPDDRSKTAHDALDAVFGTRPLGPGAPAGMADYGSAAGGPIIDERDARDLLRRGQAYTRDA